MNLLLTYTPFVFPMSPPVGIAYLKGFIDKHLPGINVKCLDMDLKWYDRQLEINNLTGIKENLKNLTSEQGSLDKKKYVRFVDDFAIIDKEKTHCLEILSGYLEGNLGDDKISPLIYNDIEAINEFSPDIIGFSMLLKSQLVYSLALAKILKKNNKKLLVIFGGAAFHSNFFPDCDKLVFPNNPVDFIIRGPGELPLLELLKNYKNDKVENITKINRLTHYDLSLKKIVKNEIQKRRNNFHQAVNPTAIPDYTSFDLKKYFNPGAVVPVRISRGCSWSRCTFCTGSSVKPGIYKKPTYQILNEIKQLKEKFHSPYFQFLAPEVPGFLLNDIADALIGAGIKIYYSIYIRPIGLINDRLLKKMYQSGCRLVNYGVESFSQRILDLMDKGTRVEEVIDLLKRTKRAKIKTHCWYILGFPSQTVKEIQEELRILKRNSCYIDFFFMPCLLFKKIFQSLSG